MDLKIDVIKNVNSKKWAPKLVFFNKKIEKDYDDFWHRKLTLNFNFGTFWHLPITYTNSQNSIIFLWVFLFLGKNLSNFLSPLENSATRIAILFTLNQISKKGAKYLSWASSLLVNSARDSDLTHFLKIWAKVQKSSRFSHL